MRILKFFHLFETPQGSVIQRVSTVGGVIYLNKLFAWPSHFRAKQYLQTEVAALVLSTEDDHFFDLMVGAKRSGPVMSKFEIKALPATNAGADEY